MDLNGDDKGMDSFVKTMSQQGAGPPVNEEAQQIPTREAEPPEEPEPISRAHVSPTARVSTDELLAQQEKAQPASPQQREVQPQQPAGAQSQGQGDVVQLQSENDLLKQRIIGMQQAAVTGMHVMNDPYLLKIVTDSMNGRRYVPVAEHGVHSLPGINEMLGLPSDFRPEPDDLYIPGTDSFKWREAREEQKVQERLDTIFEEEQKVRQEQAVLAERKAFVDRGHSEGELADLLRWVGDVNNFSLDRLHFYKTKVEEAQGNTGQIRRAPPEHVQSIGAAPGGAIPSGKTTPEQRTKTGLLRLAKDNVNPLD